MNKRLKEIRESILAENISTSEIIELQEMRDEVIETGDVLLMEWAGIPEFAEDETE